MSPRGWIAGLLAVVALAFALRAPVAGLPFERDEGGYAYLAWRWVEGELPYRDVFDQKPPAIFAFYGAALAVGGRSEAAVRWMLALWIAAGLVALAAVGRRLFSAPVGLVAAALAALMTVHPSFLGNAANTELLAFTPLAATAFAAWRSREGGAAWSVAVGALGGAALLCKPVVVPIVAYLAVTAVWRRSGALLRVGGGILGGALVLAPVAIYFAAAGGWREFADATVWNNLAYAGGVPWRQYPAAARAGIASSLVPFAPIYAAAGIACGVLAATRDGRERRALGWALGWLAVSVPAVAAGGYFREHYFLLAVPALSLLAAAGLEAGVRRLGTGRHAAAWLAILVVAVLAQAVAHDAWFFGPDAAARKMQRLYGHNPFVEAPALGRWLSARAAPGDLAFVYGSEPEVLFYAGLRSASRYIYVYPLTMPVGRAGERQREVLTELAAAPPRWVIGVFVRTSLLEQPGTPPDLRAGVRAQLSRDYRLVAVMPFQADRSVRIIEGAPARALWRERPLWQSDRPWAAFAVWERAGPDDTDR